MAEWNRSLAKRSHSRYENERDRDGRDSMDETDSRDDHDDRDDKDSGSRHKRRRSDPDSSSSDIDYRVLCPVSKIGSVIGKGGSIIKALREETRAKIKVEDVYHGSDERIIYITSSNKDRSSRDSRRDKDDRFDILCPAQDALFRILTCMTERDDQENGSREDDDEPSVHVTVRLLVPDSQVGCLIGKGGRIIEQMRKDISAQIRVLPKASLPLCAFPNDELVQLSGTPEYVKEALYAVSSKLYENPVRERPPRQSAVSQGASYPSNSVPSFQGPGSMYGMGHYSRSSSFPLRASRSDGPLEEEFMVCVLCPNEKIGSVIGKGGSIIRKIREDSGAKIRVCDQVGDADERVIQISAVEYVDSYASFTLEAVMQVFKRLAEVSMERDGKHAIFSIRLLVRANQIGCLLGKGGQIISEMRKTSRANIRIPPKDELPSCADDNSELVQVSGESANVEAALVHILTRLRTNLFSGRGGAVGSYHGSGSAYSSRDRRDDPGSPVRYSYDYGSYSSSPRSTRDSRRKQR